MKERKLEPRPIFDLSHLLDCVDDLNVKHSHVKNVYRSIIRHQISDLDQIDRVQEFPIRAHDPIKRRFTISSSTVVKVTESSDGSTTKLMIRLQDGKHIETVIMRYGDVDLRSYPEEERQRRINEIDHDLNDLRGVDGKENIAADQGSVTASLATARPYKSNKRATICVSSQVGCAMACKFCATGTMGLLENLSAGEIIEQLIHASQYERIRNVVFMGMGEPLDNYQAVCSAIHMMTDVALFGLSPSRISVSTVGIVPKIRQMIYDLPEVSLALSLHAPDQETRLKIVPTARNWPLEMILDAADEFVERQNESYFHSSSHSEVSEAAGKDLRLRNRPQPASNRDKNRRRKLLLEYVLIGPDANCLPEHAHRLGQLLGTKSEERRRNSMLNVIPYNPTSAGDRFGYEAPERQVVTEFAEIVRQYGVTLTVRQELGQDVNAACGQLVVNNSTSISNSQQQCSSSADAQDIEDLQSGIISNGANARGIGRRRAQLKVAKSNDSNSLDTRNSYKSAAKRQKRLNQLTWLILIAIAMVLARLLWKVVLMNSH